jgi:hypothetical protein
MENRVHTQYEQYNRQMMQWAILRQEFHHDLKPLESVISAIAIMTQISIQNDKPG